MTQLVDQPTAKPVRKVKYAGIVSGLLSIGAAIATAIYTGELDADALTAGLATFVTSITPVIAAYLTRDEA